MKIDNLYLLIIFWKKKSFDLPNRYLTQQLSIKHVIPTTAATKQSNRFASISNSTPVLLTLNLPNYSNLPVAEGSVYLWRTGWWLPPFQWPVCIVKVKIKLRLNYLSSYYYRSSQQCEVANCWTICLLTDDGKQWKSKYLAMPYENHSSFWWP